MSGLSVRGLTVRRGGRLVLEDLSFSAPAGSVTAILGDAGAGKTSLFAACAGLLPAERGAILVAGRDVTGAPGRRRGVAFLPPGTALAGGRQVADALRRTGGYEAALAALGGESLGARRVSELSHGEGYLALTAARLAAGDVLLLDEAGVGLAADQRLRLALLLRERALAGCTVVLATREPSVALACDHLVLLQGGRVLQTGTPASIHAEPCCADAARLTGPANIVAGVIRELRPGGFVWTGGGRFVQALGQETVRPALGTAVSLCLRPERLVLLREGDTSDNVLEGQVKDVRSAGGMLDVRVGTVLGGLRVFSPSWGAEVYPATGQMVRVGWAADAGVVVGGRTA